MVPLDLQTQPCVQQAAALYAIPMRALIAIQLTEGGELGSIAANTDGTHDHGPFQINTRWVERLRAQFGVTGRQLTTDLCWSARSAAYIVRYEINRANGSFWDGIGHYHSHTPALKYAYVRRVYANSLKF